MTRPDDPIGAFLGYYLDYNDISHSRRVFLTRILREFEEFVAPCSPLDIGSEEFAGYLAQELARGLHVNTVRKIQRGVMTFVNWTWQRRLITADQLLELRTVKPPRGATGNITPRPYSSKERTEFWRQLEIAYPWCRQTYKQSGLRNPIDRARGEMFAARWQNGQSDWHKVQLYAMRLQIEAIVALAMVGGLRQMEIYNLELEAMHPDNDYIVVRSARKNPLAEERVRAVPWMAEPMRVAITEWLDFREIINPPHDSPWLSLYAKHYLKPLRRRNFEMVLHDIGTGWSFHRMRHTAITLIVRSEMPLERVSPIVGHSRLEMTRQYAKMNHNDSVVAAARISARFTQALARHPVE